MKSKALRLTSSTILGLGMIALFNIPNLYLIFTRDELPIINLIATVFAFMVGIVLTIIWYNYILKEEK